MLYFTTSAIVFLLEQIKNSVEGAFPEGTGVEDNKLRVHYVPMRLQKWNLCVQSNRIFILEVLC